MKLHQKEFCHNCNQYVDFEFEDTTNKQIIYCPNCGHEHYRELDAGTIINIRFCPGVREIIRPVISSVKFFNCNETTSISNISNIEVERLEVLGQDENGNCIVKDEYGAPHISQRRWGRDRRQIN